MAVVSFHPNEFYFKRFCQRKVPDPKVLVLLFVELDGFVSLPADGFGGVAQFCRIEDDWASLFGTMGFWNPGFIGCDSWNIVRKHRIEPFVPGEKIISFLSVFS